jgi:DNA polymerase-3 subunit delta
MAKKTSDKTEYRALKRAVSEHAPEQLYLFHGEERYLLEYYLSEIRKIILTGGFETFNYKRYDGADLTADVLAAAIDALPVFSERTLIEIVDFDSSAAATIRKSSSLSFSPIFRTMCASSSFTTQLSFVRTTV